MATEKQKIEKHLLDAMKSLDDAIYLISEDKYRNDRYNLTGAKRTIKKTLNDSFDKLSKK